MREFTARRGKTQPIEHKVIVHDCTTETRSTVTATELPSGPFAAEIWYVSIVLALWMADIPPGTSLGSQKPVYRSANREVPRKSSSGRSGRIRNGKRPRVYACYWAHFAVEIHLSE